MEHNFIMLYVCPFLFLFCFSSFFINPHLTFLYQDVIKSYIIGVITYPYPNIS